MTHSYRRGRFLLFIPLVALGILVFGGVVMFLWNNALVPVLHISTITFWQGLGILVLSKILFSSFHGGGRFRNMGWKQKMMWDKMTPEQKEKMKEEWKNRSHGWGHKPWDIEKGPDQPGTGS